MASSKQVDKSHYEFDRYVSKERWSSIWHQLDEVCSVRPGRVLEVGPGPGLFKLIAAHRGTVVETLDLDPDLRPDHVGSATAIPLRDATYDVVCAFQVLEHLPYHNAISAFREMARVSRGRVVISLPDVTPLWRLEMQIPRLGIRSVSARCPLSRSVPHRFDGEHYWEIGKKEHPLSRVVSDLSRCGALIKTYRVPGNSYHRMFVFTCH